MILQRPAALIGPIVSLEFVMSHSLQSSPAFYSAFTEECSTLCLTSGDAAFDTNDYDRAIEFYSAVIDLNFASDTVFVKRSKAWLGKMSWTEALLDAQKVRCRLLFLTYTYCGDT
jgi:hypothetical protein